MEKIGESLDVHSLPKFETITLIVKISVIVFAIISLYFQDLTTIFSDALESETTSYILAVPLIFVYLIYRKRDMIKATVGSKEQELKPIKHFSAIIGGLLSTIAILFYWYGSYTFTPLEYHILFLPIFAAGLTLIFFNMQTLKEILFPIIFLIFMMPPPSEILYGLGATLSVISSEVSYTIVNNLGIPVTLTNDLGNPLITLTRSNGVTIPFSVDVACSGIYSLIGFLIFVVFITYIARDKISKKLTLFLIGLPIIYALNITRITVILLIGYYYGEDLALQLFHLLGGWTLIFLGTFMLLIISEKIIKLQIFKKIEKCSKCNLNTKKLSSCLHCGRMIRTIIPTLTKSDIIKIFVVIISVVLILSIQAPVVSLAQKPSLTINTSSGYQTPTNILPEINGYELTFLYRDTVFEERSKQDMSVAYMYSPNKQPNKIIYVSVEIASALSSLHKWETCLIKYPLKQGWETRVNQLELQDHQLVDNPPIFGRYFAFQYVENNLTQAVLYWYDTVTFVVNSTSQQKNVKISTIIYPETKEDLISVKNQLLDFGVAIANYWQPIKTWSPIALFFALNSNILAILPISLLTLIAIFYIYSKRKEKRMNLQAYLKLSIPNKQIIDSIQQTQKNDNSTLNTIMISYENITGKTIEKQELLSKIVELEKTGIIKRCIANKQDIPTQVWKIYMPRRNKKR